jgi:hypothetical protein
MDNQNYEAGIRFGKDCFVRFNYIAEGHVVEITVIDPEKTYEGSAILNEQE